MTSKWNVKRLAQVAVIFLAVAAVALPTQFVEAQRRGGFGGGGSFGRSGGGSFGRSSGGFSGGGGGSFGRSSGGSFGGGSRTFGGGGSFSGSRSTGGSFGRSGSFGSNSGITRSSSLGGFNRSSGTMAYGGRSYSVYGGGGGFWTGYSLGMMAGAAPWYWYTPFHPAFYVRPGYVSDGMVYPGGFNFLNFIIGLLVIGFLIWLVVRIFSGGRGPRYISYG